MLRVCVALVAAARDHRLLRLGLGPEGPSVEPSTTETRRRAGAVRRGARRPGRADRHRGRQRVGGGRPGATPSPGSRPAASEPDLTVDVPGIPLRATAAYGAVWVTSFDGQEAAAARPGHRRGGRDDQDGRRSRGGRRRLRLGVGGRPGRRQAAPHRPRHQRGQPARSRSRSAPGWSRRARTRCTSRTTPTTRSSASTRRRTRSPAPSAVCDGPQAMAVLDGKVWVTCTLSDELVALDATTLQKVASVPVEGSPDSVAATARRPARGGRRGGADAGAWSTRPRPP